MLLSSQSTHAVAGNVNPGLRARSDLAPESLPRLTCLRCLPALATGKVERILAGGLIMELQGVGASVQSD